MQQINANHSNFVLVERNSAAGLCSQQAALSSGEYWASIFPLIGSPQKTTCRIFPVRVYPFDELFCRNTFGARFWWTDSSRIFACMFSSLGQRPFYEKSIKTRKKKKEKHGEVDDVLELKKRDSYILEHPDENLFVDSIQPIRLYLYNDGLVRLILITLHLLSSQKSFRRQCLIKILLLAQHKPPVGWK